MELILQKGRRYTRRQIHDICGGGIQDYLPHKDRRVVCGCFRLKDNPDAPGEVLPGAGPEIRRWAEVFAEQKHAVPIFLKRRVNVWEYIGKFHVRKVTRSEDEILEREEKVRRKVSMILHLESDEG